VNAWKIVLATLVIFIAGLVTGGLLVSYSDRAQQKHHRVGSRELVKHHFDNKQPAANGREPFSRPGFPGAMPQGLRMDFLQNLTREIQLTAEQQAGIEKIITEGQERNGQLWNRVLPERRREIQNTRERIPKVLTPEQVKRFEKLMKQTRPAGTHTSEDPAMKSDRRLRDQPRHPLPPQEGSLPDRPPQPSPPAEPPANQ